MRLPPASGSLRAITCMCCCRVGRMRSSRCSRLRRGPPRRGRGAHGRPVRPPLALESGGVDFSRSRPPAHPVLSAAANSSMGRTCWLVKAIPGISIIADSQRAPISLLARRSPCRPGSHRRRRSRQRGRDRAAPSASLPPISWSTPPAGDPAYRTGSTGSATTSSPRLALMRTSPSPPTSSSGRRDKGWKGIFIQSQPPATTRMGVLFPIEGDPWIVTVQGVGDDRPPDRRRRFRGVYGVAAASSTTRPSAPPTA